MKAHCLRCASSSETSTSPRCAAPQPSRRRAPAPRSRGCAQRLMCINPRINSVNAAAAIPIQKHHTHSSSASNRVDTTSGFHSDILGLGQAIVDWSASVNDEVLSQFAVPKGGRRVITVDERASVMETLDDIGAPSQVSAGGSLANTLVGVAKLARAAGKDMRVALGGSLGTDTLGQYFNSQMRQAGVRCLLDTAHHHHHHHPVNSIATTTATQDAAQHAAQQHTPAESGTVVTPAAASSPAAHGHTGTVMVLTTPDAQRSFLSFFTSESLTLSERLRSAIRASRLVVVEGYMWEMPGAEEYINQVLDLAHATGAMVAMTAGDPGVVSRHRAAMLRVIARGVDMLFTNEDEAAALVGLTDEEQGEEEEEGGERQGASSISSSISVGERAALALAERCPVAVVTAGSRGSYICAMGEMHVVPPYWLPQGPVDTCGAGDAYAAGWLYSLLAGYDLRTVGEFASRVASAVIGRYGPHLSDEDAEELVRQLPEHTGALCVRGIGSLELGAGDFSDF